MRSLCWAFVLLAGALCPMAAAGAPAKPAAWWDARWDHRCRLVVQGGEVSLRDVPIVLSGSRLRPVLGQAPVSSLRVVGPQGEIPSQFDERDGTGTVVANPNHVLDNDDDLVFQADLPAAGAFTGWLYWNSEPLPPGRYPSRTLIGDAMEPELLQHDIQLWNDDCRVGLRGPARGEDPSKNQIENWGAGALVLCDVLRLPVTNIHSAWAAIFPLGTVACRPCPDAARWERPRILARGPVRVAAACSLRGAEFRVEGQPAAKVDVEHRVWLYDRGALVCFEEEITPAEPLRRMALHYEAGLPFGRLAGDTLHYAAQGGLHGFAPTPEQIAEGEKGKVVMQASGMDPWMAGASGTAKRGYALLLDTGEATPGDACATSFFSRTTATLRYSRTCSDVGAGRPVLQRFWILGLPNPQETRVPPAFRQAIARPTLSFGPPETRGGR